jgi:hypothetical protein
MSVEEIELAVQRLSGEELEKFRQWFLEFDQDLWDLELERDVAAGRLDALAEEALTEHRAGCTAPL